MERIKIYEKSEMDGREKQCVENNLGGNFKSVLIVTVEHSMQKGQRR